MFKYKRIDKKQVEQRLNSINNPGQKRNIFKVTEEPQVIRIIPYIHNESGCPFVERNLHYKMQGGTLICPTSYGQDCPICRFATQLWKKGEKEMAKKFFKSDRVYVPVISRDSSGDAPKFMGLSQTNYQDILNTIADPDYGDVVHPMEGRDLTIVKIAQGQFGKVSIKFKPKTSPIAENEKQIEKIIASCQNFDSVYPKKTYEELKKILEATINASATQNNSIPSDDRQPEDKNANKKYLDQINQALGN